MPTKECVVLFRNPSNGRVGFIREDITYSDRLAVFPNRDEAIKLAQEHFLLKAWPYQIVDLDEI